MAPSVIYTPAVRAAIAAAQGHRAGGVHAVAHITGGGIVGNVPRMLPAGLGAVLDRGTWEIPPIFGEIRRLGNVSDREMVRVFNPGWAWSCVSVRPACTMWSGPYVAPRWTRWWWVGSPLVGARLEFAGPALWPGSDQKGAHTA